MSKLNIVDAISYLESISFELQHSENRLLTIGSQTFKCDEINDNLTVIMECIKFMLDKKARD
jgi:ribosomal protein L1